MVLVVVSIAVKEPEPGQNSQGKDKVVLEPGDAGWKLEMGLWYESNPATGLEEAGLGDEPLIE